MNRLLLPMLLLAAIGLPIWHVLSPKPWEKSDVTDPATSGHPTSKLGGTDIGRATSPTSTAPISVYSQASYSNPATSYAATHSTSTFPTTFPTTVPASSPLASPTASYHGAATVPMTLPVIPATPDMTRSSVGIRGNANSFAETGNTTLAPLVSDDVFEKMSGQTIIYSGDASGPDFSAPPMEFVPITNLADIFRFDISPNWVKQRWKRVSTSPGELGLGGLRVALVTGTNSNDLHGSLTYYFDTNKQLQRITFRGWSGNSSKLVELLTQRYDFESRNTQLAGLYVAKSWTKTTGGLAIKNPVVIRADNPAQQVAFALEINNPQGTYGLSPSFQSIISNATSSQ